MLQIPQWPIAQKAERGSSTSLAKKLFEQFGENGMLSERLKTDSALWFFSNQMFSISLVCSRIQLRSFILPLYHLPKDLILTLCSFTISTLSLCQSLKQELGWNPERNTVPCSTVQNWLWAKQVADLQLEKKENL